MGKSRFQNSCFKVELRNSSSKRDACCSNLSILGSCLKGEVWWLTPDLLNLSFIKILVIVRAIKFEKYNSTEYWVFS